MPLEDRREEDRALLKRHLAQLAEHFDSIRIFVTRHDGADGETMAFSEGVGNYYAQFGQINEWVERMRECTREHERRHTDDDDSNPGD